ncbi:unnamed protein product, partial [Didymodactylos carnosus]
MSAKGNSKKRRVPNIALEKDSNIKNVKKSVNEIRNIEQYVSNITATLANDIMVLLIDYFDGKIDIEVVEEKLKLLTIGCPSLMYRHIIYELYYDDKQLLKKFYFVLLSIIINKHYTRYSASNSKLYNRNIRQLLKLFVENNILEKFEQNQTEDVNSSPEFSLISTFMLTIISHDNITTQDIHLFTTILMDPIITKTVANWPILKSLLQLFRQILNVQFVQDLYLKLINDEIKYSQHYDKKSFA